MNEASRKALKAWLPVEISIYDVDTCETYLENWQRKSHSGSNQHHFLIGAKKGENNDRAANLL